jgi:transcriptional regulator with XRE-family HTH domain
MVCCAQLADAVVLVGVLGRRDEAIVADIGRRLRHFRGESGMTQEAVARAAKLSPKFVSQIENGRVNPSIAVLTRLVEDGLGLSFAVFFAWSSGDGDLSSVVALLAAQPLDRRKKIIRAVESLCGE